MTIREYMEQNKFRYHSDWQKISKKCRRQTNNICCWCWKNEATLTHHAAYINPRNELVGWDDIGALLFPLCQDCHLPIAHHPSNWIVSRFGIMANRNTEKFQELLMIKFYGLKLNKNQR